MASWDYLNNLSEQQRANIYAAYDAWVYQNQPKYDSFAQSIPSFNQWYGDIDQSWAESYAGAQDPQGIFGLDQTDLFSNEGVPNSPLGKNPTSANGTNSETSRDSQPIVTGTPAGPNIPAGAILVGGGKGIMANDDPGGMGPASKDVPPAKDTIPTDTGATTSGGGGGGGGGGTSTGGSSWLTQRASDTTSSTTTPDPRYPVIPMTDSRRRMLEHFSAINGGAPAGGFRTPPGGWDPRMEAMFTTGAFAPVTASEQQIADAANKPRPTLPPLPKNTISMPQQYAPPTVPGNSQWTGSAPWPTGMGMPVTKPAGFPSGGKTPTYITYQDMLKKIGSR